MLTHRTQTYRGAGYQQTGVIQGCRFSLAVTIGKTIRAERRKMRNLRLLVDLTENGKNRVGR